MRTFNFMLENNVWARPEDKQVRQTLWLVVRQYEKNLVLISIRLTVENFS
jgi:uncharacterized lipoprotein YmbA